MSPLAAQDAERTVRAALGQRYGSAGLLLTDSGTSALVVALGALAGRAPRPVAVPAFACFDIATAVDAIGAPFVLYDINPSTFGPDLQSLRRALEGGADRVLVAHLFGVPVDMHAVRTLTHDFGARLVEDAAQGFGGSIDGRALGTLGDLGVISFGRGKGLTGGAGGALVIPELSVQRIEQAPLPGGGPGWAIAVATAAQWILGRPTLYGIPAALPFLGLGETVYRSAHPPRGPAAFAVGTLSRTVRLIDAELVQRRANASRLLAALQGTDLRSPVSLPGGLPSYLRLPVLASRDRELRAHGARRLGVVASYPYPLADLAGFGDRRVNRAEEFPGARTLTRRLLTLPTYGMLTDQDLRRLEEWIRRVP